MKIKTVFLTSKKQKTWDVHPIKSALTSRCALPADCSKALSITKMTCSYKLAARALLAGLSTNPIRSLEPKIFWWQLSELLADSYNGI